jgi:predicted transcriptional regulator
MLETEIKILRDISDAKKRNGNEDIVFVHPETPVKEVLKIIQENGYSNIPVMHDRKPLGCIRENRLMAKLLRNPELLNSTAENVSDECFPVVDAKADISEVKEYLKDNPAIMVSDFGRITDIITRYDLLEFTN